MFVRSELLVLSLAALGTGCLGPWNPQTPDTTNETATTGQTAETALTGDTGPIEKPIVSVPTSITEDTRWTNDAVYRLTDIVYVESDATLTIDPGTLVIGNTRSALVITRDAAIDARGTATEPIVFTSSQPEGSRKTGDWAGVVLLGDAPSNKGESRQVEGISLEEEPRAFYGGNAPSESCGFLEYVRIEFAGFELTLGDDGNELNGLTLAGCGTNTFIRFVQVHRGLDDGIEVFGGSVDLKWFVVSGAGDDSLDWDEGWNGRVQFGVIQQLPRIDDSTIVKDGDEGFEGDGAFLTGVDVNPADGLDDIREPYTFPRIANISIFGSEDPATEQNAMELKEGTAAEISNLLIGRQTGRGVNIVNEQTPTWLDPTPPMPTDGSPQPLLTIRNSVFFEVGADGVSYASPDVPDDDGGFDELAWLQEGSSGNQFGVDPDLPDFDLAGAWVTNPGDFWIPGPGAMAVLNAGPTLPNNQGAEFFDQQASYAGAIRPGDTAPWWQDWTSFPEN